MDRSSNRNGELIRGVFELLWNKPAGLMAEEIISLLPEIIHISENEIQPSPLSSMPLYEWMVRVSAISLSKAGWLVKTESGRWFITQKGREASRKHSSVQDFYSEALRLSNQSGDDDPELYIFLEHTKERNWKFIREYLQELKISEFKQLIVDLLEAMKCHVQWVAPLEKDRGQIDIIAHTHPLGIGNYRIVVQVKHSGQAVTVEGVKSFQSILSDDDFGMLISTGGFTQDARDEMVISPLYRKIQPVTLEKFFSLWIKNYDLLSRESHVRFPLQSIHLLSPPG